MLAIDAELRLTALELVERLATLIPPPRLHRHRSHGVLAPNAPQRAQVPALARQPILPPRPAPDAANSAQPVGGAAGGHLRDFGSGMTGFAY
jgi:hypothetical protein